MNYTVIINSHSYSLPKYTLDVAEKLDEVVKFDNLPSAPIREKYEKVFDFIKGCIGEENASEAFGGDSINSIDLTEVTLAFKDIHAAYTRPAVDKNMNRMNKELSGIPIDKIATLLNAAEKIGAK